AISASTVGASRSIRVASVTAPSLTGTFKSARNSTVLLRTSRSSSVRNLAISLAPWICHYAAGLPRGDVGPSLVLSLCVDGSEATSTGRPDDQDHTRSGKWL